MKISRSECYEYLKKLESLYSLKHHGDPHSRFANCVHDNYSVLQALYNANVEGAKAFRELQEEVRIATAPKQVVTPAKTEPIPLTFSQMMLGKKQQYRIVEPKKTESVPLTQEEGMKIYEDLLEKNVKAKEYMNETFEWNVKHCDKQYRPPMSAAELTASEFLFNPNKTNIILPPEKAIITK